MKKIFSLFVVLILGFSFLSKGASAKAENDVIAPCYTNTTAVQSILSIDKNGLATIDVYCSGISNTTSIRVVTYIERYIGGLWARINIAPTNDEWAVWTNASYYTATRTHQLESTGYYRAVSIFTVTAATAETITLYSYATY